MRDMGNENRNDRPAPRTKLSQGELLQTQEVVLDYLKTHDTITNRALRQMTSVGYDQAVHFFNEMVSSGVLLRIGKGSGTKYVLPDR